MIGRREPDEVEDWLLAFHSWSPSRLVRLMIPGKFKHVTAFAWSPRALTWVFLDFSLDGARVIVLPAGDQALFEIGRLIDGAAVLRVKALPKDGRRQLLVFGCVGAIKHLLSLRCGAVRPDSLWRFLVKSGAQVVIDGCSQAKHARPSGGQAGPAALAGDGGDARHQPSAA